MKNITYWLFFNRAALVAIVISVYFFINNKFTFFNNEQHLFSKVYFLEMMICYNKFYICIHHVHYNLANERCMIIVLHQKYVCLQFDINANRVTYCTSFNTYLYDHNFHLFLISFSKSYEKINKSKQTNKKIHNICKNLWWYGTSEFKKNPTYLKRKQVSIY